MKMQGLNRGDEDTLVEFAPFGADQDFDKTLVHVDLGGKADLPGGRIDADIPDFVRVGTNLLDHPLLQRRIAQSQARHHG